MATHCSLQTPSCCCCSLFTLRNKLSNISHSWLASTLHCDTHIYISNISSLYNVSITSFRHGYFTKLNIQHTAQLYVLIARKLNPQHAMFSFLFDRTDVLILRVVICNHLLKWSTPWLLLCVSAATLLVLLWSGDYWRGDASLPRPPQPSPTHTPHLISPATATASHSLLETSTNVHWYKIR